MNIEYQKKNSYQGLALESGASMQSSSDFQTTIRNSLFRFGFLFVVGCLLLIAPTSVSAFQKPPNNLGLLAYWSLDDGSGTIATDFSGRGNSGALSNTPSWVNGKYGKALVFNGTNQSVTTSNAINLVNTNFTFSFWVKVNAFQVSSPFISSLVGEENAGVSTALIRLGDAAQPSNRLQFVVYNGSSQKLNSNTDLSAGVWYHVAGTFTNSAMTLYINGVQDVTMNPGGFASANDVFGLATSPLNGRNLNGYLDEVRVYSRALAPDEIKTLYRAGSAKFTTPSSTGLVGYWSMDDATSTVASDLSGNKNNGTLTTFSTPATSLSGWLTAGKRGGALTFDGTSDFVDIGNVGALDMGTSDWTTSAWVKTSDTSSNPMMVSKMQFVGGATDAWYMELLSSGRLHAGLFKGGRTIQNTADDGATVNDNKWHHIAVTWTRSGNLLRYVDGVVTGSAKDISGEVGQSIVNSQKANIGARDGGAGNELFYKGSIDDVRVYRRALSATEIASLYRSGQVEINASQNNKVSNGLVGFWSMNGQDITWGSNFLRDGSGNGNNGTLSSFSKTGSIDFGVNGQALKFDNSATQITTATQFSNPQTFSLSIWFKTTVASGHKLIGFGDSQLTDAGSYDRHIYMGTDGKIYFGWYPGSVTTVVSLSTLNDGNWHHAVGTHDGSTGILYIDGVVQGTNTGSPQSYSGYWRIGGATLATWTNASNGFFSGLLDEARVYNRTITPQEVKQLFNMGRSL